MKRWEEQMREDEDAVTVKRRMIRELIFPSDFFSFSPPVVIGAVVVVAIIAISILSVRNSFMGRVESLQKFTEGQDKEAERIRQAAMLEAWKVLEEIGEDPHDPTLNGHVREGPDGVHIDSQSAALRVLLDQPTQANWRRLRDMAEQEEDDRLPWLHHFVRFQEAALRRDLPNSMALKGISPNEKQEQQIQETLQAPLFRVCFTTAVRCHGLSPASSTAFRRAALTILCMRSVSLLSDSRPISVIR